MVLTCEDVWREVSSYVDGDVDPALKIDMDRHFSTCRNCRAILDGIRNIVELYGDEKAFTLPSGFYPQLHRKLADRIEGKRGSRSAALLAVAASILLGAAVWILGVRGRNAPQLRAVMSEPASRLPSGTIVVADDTKVFHVAGCAFIHGKPHPMPAEEAVREGFSPCVRCLHEFLQHATTQVRPLDDDVASKDPAMSNGVR